MLINVKAKDMLINTIPKNLIVPLIARVLLGSLVYYLFIASVKLFPLFLVSIVVNTQALLISLLAYLTLGESLKRSQVVCLVVAFAGIYMLVSSKETDKGVNSD